MPASHVADESPAVYPVDPRKPKPDFHQAMGGDQAQQLYEAFIKKLAASDGPKAVATGVFGALMQALAGPGGPQAIFGRIAGQTHDLL